MISAARFQVCSSAFRRWDIRLIGGVETIPACWATAAPRRLKAELHTEEKLPTFVTEGFGA
jgi:hypothetical protein